MFYVYILYSKPYDKYYVGQSGNIQNRLGLHNSGKVVSTKPYMPWKMIWHGSKETRSEAVALERKLKNLTKERIKQFVGKYDPD